MTLTVDIHTAAATHIGHVRRHNEDAHHEGRHLVAVADGLGGHVAGDIASNAAINAVADFDQPTSPDQLVTAAVKSVNAANRALRYQIDRDPTLSGMGTTLVALLWAGDRVATVGIGDSRIYRRRDGRMTQVTDDHVYAGLVSGAARMPTLAGRLTRFIDGRPEGVSADVVLHDLRAGDRWLLCSDGLSSYVPEAEIKAALTEDDDPNMVAERLVRLALDQGGHDNVTVVIVDVQ